MSEVSFLRSRPRRAEQITIVAASLAGGGTERFAADLSRALQESGRQVTLITWSGNDPDDYALPVEVNRERVEIREVSASRLDTVRLFLRSSTALRQKIISTRPDVVVSLGDLTNVRTIGCLVGTRIPKIAAERTDPMHHRLSKRWRTARDWAYPLADAVLVQTPEIAQWFNANTRVKRLAVIPNAVRDVRDLQSRFQSGAFVSNREPIVMGMGRLSREKGFDLLLAAFAKSHLSQDGWQLLILGEGPEREALSGMAAAFGIANALNMPGRVNDIEKWLDRASVFVLPSRYEGFPNALLEAMQVGLACVSFDSSSAARRILVDHRNGLLVAGNDVEGLSAALRNLAVDPQLRAQLGAEASRVGEQFSRERIYGEWLRVLDAAASGQLEAYLHARREQVEPSG